MRFVQRAHEATHTFFLLVSSDTDQSFLFSLRVVNPTHEKTVRWRLDAMKKLHPWTGYHTV